MSLARRFYDVLVDVLHDTHDLEAGAGILRTDRTIAKRFDVSESTVKNWRRGKHSHAGKATTDKIVAICSQIAPTYVPDLQFIDRLGHGAHEVKLAAEMLVEQLSTHVFEHGSTWHIYSGPLKIAFDPRFDAYRKLKLMDQSSMVVERVLEMGIDQVDIPCISELIRYSTHGWYLGGQLRVREVSLKSQIAGIDDGTLGTIEAALYFGDGCAIPSLIQGYPERAKQYTDQALELLETVTSSEERNAGTTIRDAQIMIRSIQVLIACHARHPRHLAEVNHYACEFADSAADTEWIEGTRQEALGYLEVVRRTDFPKAAVHFEQARLLLDRWLSQFNIPFSSTSSQSLQGYALLMSDGPTESVQAHISEGLLRTIELGAIEHQIKARLCRTVFFDCQSQHEIAQFHREKAQALACQFDLQRWYDMLNQLLCPPSGVATHTKYSYAGQASIKQPEYSDLAHNVRIFQS
ncbi:MAG: hypothetical protein ACYDBJ_22835 [Aggregatilineales bacterium]